VPAARWARDGRLLCAAVHTRRPPLEERADARRDAALTRRMEKALRRLKKATNQLGHLRILRVRKTFENNHDKCARSHATGAARGRPSATATWSANWPSLDSHLPPRPLLAGPSASVRSRSCARRASAGSGAPWSATRCSAFLPRGRGSRTVESTLVCGAAG